jgi:hypothetical protein
MAARFPTTLRSRVVRAGDPADPGARAALEDLCCDYWFPLYAFARRRGVLPPSAVEDIVQGRSWEAFWAEVAALLKNTEKS